MSEPFVGEIRMFAGHFAPRGYALCDGQLLSVSNYDALFSLLGTMYGGDGRTTFGLPDLRGRIPIHCGTGPGLTPRRQGAKGGSETETITEAQLPSHVHQGRGSSEEGTSPNPRGAVPALAADGDRVYLNRDPNDAMRASITGNTGGGQPHTNTPPFLCVNFIIALFGIYPSRT